MPAMVDNTLEAAYRFIGGSLSTLSQNKRSAMKRSLQEIATLTTIELLALLDFLWEQAGKSDDYSWLREAKMQLVETHAQRRVSRDGY